MEKNVRNGFNDETVKNAARTLKAFTAKKPEETNGCLFSCNDLPIRLELKFLSNC